MMVQKSLTIKKAIKKAKPNSRNSALERIIQDAVEKVFTSLGKVCKQAVFFRLATDYGIAKEEIPQKIDAFADAIEEMFGAAGKLIQIKIMKLAFSEMGNINNQEKQKNLFFKDYMKELYKS